MATTTRILRLTVSGMGAGVYDRSGRRAQFGQPAQGGSALCHSAVVGVLACGVVALLLAGGGGKSMETTVQDDAIFLHRSTPQISAAARTVKRLGGDRIRLTAGWQFIAPRARSRNMPRGRFVPTDPATYPLSRWLELDRAVKIASDAGLKVQLDVGFWAPRWAVLRWSKGGRYRWWPDAEKFGDFATAVARRYNGTFPDPVDHTRRLPAVRMYTPWNEPNHNAFLLPQWVHDTHGGWRPESPHIYRAMYQEAYAAIKRVNPFNRVLLGNTSPEGSTDPGRHGVAPLEFLRTMACVDAQLQPLRLPECRHFRPLQADGYAHHPYARDTTPAAPATEPDDVPLGSALNLDTLLTALAERGRITSNLDVYFTEFGYESSQDDPYVPFDRAQQAAYLSWASYLAYQDPRVRMFAQFHLRDIDPRESGRTPGTPGYYRDFQSGLYDVHGRAKPAARAFKLPFWAQLHGDVGAADRIVVLWGQVRPNRGAEIVRVERRPVGPGPQVWAPTTTWGHNCDAQGAAFITTSRASSSARCRPARRRPTTASPGATATAAGSTASRCASTRRWRRTRTSRLLDLDDHRHARVDRADDGVLALLGELVGERVALAARLGVEVHRAVDGVDVVGGLAHEHPLDRAALVDRDGGLRALLAVPVVTRVDGQRAGERRRGERYQDGQGAGEGRELLHGVEAFRGFRGDRGSRTAPAATGP